MKVCERCGDENYTRDGDNVCDKCERKPNKEGSGDAQSTKTSVARSWLDEGQGLVGRDILGIGDKETLANAKNVTLTKTNGIRFIVSAISITGTAQLKSQASSRRVMTEY